MKAISIDWLTLNLRGEPKNRFNVNFEQLNYGTRQFMKLYRFSYYDVLIGTLSTCPYLQSLPKDYCQLKVENHLLYQEDSYMLLINALNNAFLKIVDVSRIDICCDFNCFSNGLSPQDFLKRFAANKYYTMSKCKFTLFGEKRTDNEFSYLSIGSKSSAIKTILYNKSKEMREVKHKDWIQEHWNINNIDSSRDVWRLEFSIKHDFGSLVDKSDGSEVKASLDWLKRGFDLKQVFSALYSRYFRFIKATNLTNHYRQESINLLDFADVKTKRVCHVRDSSTNRASKIFAARLCTEVNKADIVNTDKRTAVIDWTNTWLLRRNLFDYAYKRGVLPTW